MKKDEKHFMKWINLKERLHKACRVTGIKEGQIWWVAMGENVGVEINGKSEKFSRPVLVFKKFGRYSFMAIPLTSQFHEGSWYAEFDFKDMKQYAVLSQARHLSVSRLYGDPIGKISNADFRKVYEAFMKLYYHDFGARKDER